MSRRDIWMWIAVTGLVAIFAVVAVLEGARAAAAEAQARRLVARGWNSAYQFSFSEREFDQACINRHSY